MLFGDEWTITLPDIETTFDERQFGLTISPDDPRPAFYLGEYVGESGQVAVVGDFTNLRATTGLDPLTEAKRQFARLGITRGPNYQFAD